MPQTDKINQINKSFYNAIASDFSRTRQKPWKGWDRVVELIKQEKSLKPKLADLACGDGRFYKFLINNQIIVDYEGYDISTNLLKLARANYPEATFIEKDILTKTLDRNYDIVTLFGIMHHIMDKNARLKLFNKIIKATNPNGLTIITFWNFNPEKEKIFNDKTNELDIKLYENDYILDWGGPGKNLRICHKYSADEIQGIIEFFTNSGFELLQRFESDKENEYLVLRNGKKH